LNVLLERLLADVQAVDGQEAAIREVQDVGVSRVTPYVTVRRPEKRASTGIEEEPIVTRGAVTGDMPYRWGHTHRRSGGA